MTKKCGRSKPRVTPWCKPDPSRPSYAISTRGSSFGNEAKVEDRWSVKHLEYIRDLWRLDDEQYEQLVAMKLKLKDIDHWKNNPYEVVRFVTGPQGFDKAEGLFRAMVKWRIENSVDTILENYKPPQMLLDYLPSAILAGYDKEGDPIYLERGGAMDGPGLLNRFGRERLLKHIIWSRELAFRGRWIEEYELKMGKPPTRLTIIYDLQGLNSRHLMPGVLPLLNEAMKLTQLRYNGIAKKMIVIRAPALFNVVWGVCKYVFPKNALKKMVFSGPNNYLQVLDDFVERDVLPPCIVPGGKGLVAIDMPSNLNGGIIPDHLTGLEGEDEEGMGMRDVEGMVRYESTTSVETDSNHPENAVHQFSPTTDRRRHLLVTVRGRRITSGWWNGHNPATSLRVCSQST